MQKKKFNLKVGLFGIGLEVYWDQFAGLKDRLENYLKVVENKISKYSDEVIKQL
jgi:L-arabinose isomerase